MKYVDIVTSSQFGRASSLWSRGVTTNAKISSHRKMCMLKTCTASQHLWVVDEEGNWELLSFPEFLHRSLLDRLITSPSVDDNYRRLTAKCTQVNVVVSDWIQGVLVTTHSLWVVDFKVNRHSYTADVQHINLAVHIHFQARLTANRPKLALSYPTACNTF